MREYNIGTRESKLAMWQANWVAERLRELSPGIKINLVGIKTKGDKILDTALAKIGDKGLFTRELEHSLLSEQIDLAVHSMKDLPTALPEGLILGAICERECPADVLIAPQGCNLGNLPVNANIGTSSLRRIAQLKKYRSDFNMVNVRGNLDTRLRKLNEENIDALILAYAGISRLGYSDRICQQIPYEICLPAVGQGSVGVEVRADDHGVIQLLKGLNHSMSSRAIRAERALLKALEGGCQVPIGALARVSGQEISMEAMVSSMDGQTMLRVSMVGDTIEPERLGNRLANRMLKLGAAEILKKVRQEFDCNG
ncbi:MAG: hydroxymethylbilane synthase [Peptococcaceae bacterium]|nr:hydroxymethylbilane synthase [Peptococcaceae bacterium]